MILDLIVGIGLILGTCIAVIALFWGVYLLVIYRDLHEREFLTPCTREAKRWKNDKKSRKANKNKY